ncbi:MAG TPA: tripartite tricarboxylate transporter substrate binding protein [Pseudorhodoferax sp.]|jgi:tripartite-type tricarboxylate transporter receptor subunit TctC|nr:tripartite tricarboxylate transporter substrate binding protein [Pseudorhodoferax sp.]
MRKLALSLVAACTLAAVPFAASAQSYPDGTTPIRIVVPYAAGGSSDFMARLFAKKLSENMGHSFVVDNKPGGNTIIGADYVAKSKPDGYTLYLIGELTHGSLGSLNPKLPFDPAKDFAGVSNLIESPLVVSVPPQFPASNLKEFVAYAQAHPGQVNYGSAGTGNTLHLAAEQFSKVAKVQMNHVQYKGASQAVLDLLAGRIQVMFDLPQTPLPHIQGGALKALAVTAKTRLPMLPQVPTTAEAGFPAYTFTTRVGIAAPAGTPEPILNKLNAEIRKASQDPEVQQALEKQAMLVATSATPQEHQQRLAAGIKMVSELLAGTKPAQ